MSGTKYTRNLPNNAYQAAVNSNTPSGTNPFATIDDLSIGNGNQLISGGASYSGTGLVFDVSILEYAIAGVLYTSVATQVTLSAGDPTNSRFDAIVADENLLVSVIIGTPAPTPLTPAIGADQILVQYVLIGANAVTPTIITENVYLESNVGWPNKGLQNVPINTTVDFANTVNPFQGSESTDINSGQYSSNRGIYYSANVPISRADYVVLSIRVYLTEDLTNVPGFAGTRRPIVRVYGDNTITSTPGNLVGYRYLDDSGLNYSLLNTWQLITIPTSLLISNPSLATMGALVFGLTGNDSPTFTASNYKLDDIKFQTGYGPSTSTPTIDILKNGVVVADTSKVNFIPGTGTTIAVTEDILNAKVDVQISATGGSSLYSADGTIVTARTATIQNGLTWSGSTETRVTNGRTIKEVITAADLGTTLSANTTYVIRGKVIVTQTIQVVNVGSEVVGLNRDVDEIEWRGAGDLFFIRDQNFSMSNLKLSSNTPGNNIIQGTNVGGGYNFARNKVLTLVNCQFRGTYDVMDINGFDLVDINNCLFFYIKATNWGLRFRDTSKIEITSCELIRWFDETSIPAPTGYSTVSMIELRTPLATPGFGAVNINSCIIHPQQTQTGINISTGSTTGFGTISSNAFINVGLTPVTGNVFLPVVSNLPDYSSTATKNYDIFANQGLLNSTSGCLMTFIGNTNDTDLTQNVPLIIETNGLAVAQASVRFTISTAGRCTYIGSKQVYVSLHGTLSYDKQQNGTDTYRFYFYKNGIQLPQSQTTIEPEQNATNIGSTSLTYGTLMTENDYIEIYVENITSGDDIIVTDLQFLIRE